MKESAKISDGGSVAPTTKQKKRSLRKSSTGNIEANIKKEASVSQKSILDKRRLSSIITFKIPNEPSELTLVEAESEEKVVEIEPEVIPVKDDSQITLIRNFSLDSDDEIDVIPDKPMTMIEVQRKLYIQECKKKNVIPIRVLAELTENIQTLNVSHFSLGPKGAKAMAIPLHLNTTITSLNMEDNDIGPNGCQCIAEVLLENSAIEDLNLAHNNIGFHGLACICRIFKNNISITKLNLSGNGLGDTNTDYLAFLLQLPFLKELYLSGNEFEYHTAQTIGENLGSNETLETFDISWNHFRHRGAEAIAKGLTDNTVLKKLDISYNGFGSEGIIAMSAALSCNQTLQDLDISHNRITDEGVTTLCNSLNENRSLLHLKIGGNPLTTFAATALVTMVNKSTNSKLASLDLQDIFIDQAFLDLVKETKQTKSLFVIHGSICDLELIESKLLQAKLANTVPLSVDGVHENNAIEMLPDCEPSATDMLSENPEEAETGPAKEEEQENDLNVSQLQMDAAGELSV